MITIMTRKERKRGHFINIRNTNNSLVLLEGLFDLYNI